MSAPRESPVEAGARAIYVQERTRLDEDALWSTLDDASRETYREDARACIEAAIGALSDEDLMDAATTYDIALYVRPHLLRALLGDAP